MKKDSRTQLLDRVHKWSVRGLIGLTLFGGATITLQIYNYYTTLKAYTVIAGQIALQAATILSNVQSHQAFHKKVRPLKLSERQKQKEMEISMEQEEREAELLRRQKDAES